MASSSNGVPVAVIIILVVFAGIIQLVTVILIIRCIQNMKKASITPRSKSSPIAPAEAAAVTSSSHSSDSRIEMRPIEEFLERILKEKPKRFTPQKLVEITGNYAEKLGAGGNGTVYKGQFPNGLPVAVKVLHGRSSQRAEEQFMAEVGTISRTYHINLVKLYGFCFEESLSALIYEYLERGSLDKYLFEGGGGEQGAAEIDIERLYGIAVGTAKGIRYLHEECQHKIVHYDIKPGNILLTAEFVPKVADFGLAKLCERNKLKAGNPMGYFVGGGRGTPGYAAPEMWLPVPVTHKADVYSYGMLLLEMLGRRRNYDVKQVESREWFPIWVWQRYDKGEIDSIISACGVGEEHRKKAERMCKVALRCIQYKAEDRPIMSHVVQMLEGNDEIPDVYNPFEHMTSPYSTNSALWSSFTSTTTSKNVTGFSSYSTSRGTGSGGSTEMISHERVLSVPMAQSSDF